MPIKLMFIGIGVFKRMGWMMRSPSLIFRISHLILIQVVFIFSAVALVVFYPHQDFSPDARHNEMIRRVGMEANNVAAVLERQADPRRPDDSARSLFNELVEGTDMIRGLDLVYVDTLTGEATLIHLASADDDHFVHDLAGVDGFMNMVVKLLDSRLEPCLAVVSTDGKTLNIFIRPQNAESYALAIMTPSAISENLVGDSRAYLLLILFMVTTLISLLIINLINRGIRRPLNLLVDGFEKTASGEECLIAEEGDDQMRHLIVSFNTMSQTLAEKNRELAKSNRELLISNQNLAESESILTALVDYSPEAIIVSDLDDHVLIYNQAAAREFGYNQNNMLGKKITNLIPLESGAEGIERAGREEPDTQEVVCRRRNGATFPAVLVRTPLGLEGCRPKAVLYFIKSISESENYRRMVLKLDRIATRGKMARDIAHEINNYLAILQGNLELLPMILAKDNKSKCEEKVQLMRDTVARISNFTDGLTRFSDESSDFIKEDLNQLVENLVAFLKPQNKFDGIEITTNLSEELPLVALDAGQIQLLLVNLLNNAAEALAGASGRKWIIISTMPDSETGSAAIKIADSGKGIDEQNISKLFVTRFSTKKNGNGLGLITCKHIIDNHGGEIAYHFSEESQSVFSVIIPVGHEAGASACRPAADEKASQPV